MQPTFMPVFEPTADEPGSRSARLYGAFGVLLCLMVLGSLVVSSARAADSFTRVIMETGPDVAGAADVAPVDLDGDGDTDAVVVAESGALAWLENDGTNVVFTAHTIDSGSRLIGALKVVPVDVDGDKALDLVTGAGDTVVWYENGGAGQSFTRHVIDSGQRTADVRDLDVEDLNGDGLPDVVVAVDGTFAWYENDGTGLNFIRHVIESRSVSGARALRSVDLNGDGNKDVVGAASEGLFFYERKPSNNPNRPDRFKRRRIARGTKVRNPRDLEPVDVDGDGNTDLILAAGDTIAWYRNQGNNRRFRRLVVDTGRPVAAARDVSVKDIDGDGTIDVLTASGDTFTWYENNGTNRGFTRHVIESGEFAGGARDIEPVDVDGDGDQDVMTAAAGANEVAWHANPNVFIVDDDGAADPGPVDCRAPASAPSAVSDALSRVTVADTVWVCPGTYSENLHIPSSQSYLKLAATGDSTNTVITAADPSRSVLEVTAADGVLIEGINLRGPPVRFSEVRGLIFRNNRLDSDVGKENQMEFFGSDTTVVMGNVIRARHDTAVVLDQDSDSNVLVANRFVNTRYGLVLAGASDANIVRDNRIDTHFVGVSIVHANGEGPEGNRFENNTIRAANTGIAISGTGGNGPRNVARNNNIASNYEGLENVTNRVFDARRNWWGDTTGPGAIPGDVNRDPVTGVLAVGEGDSIVSVDAEENQGPDTNVAFDPWLNEQAVRVQPLPDTFRGCVVERLGTPTWLMRTLRGFRDGVLSGRVGRVIVRQYYRRFGS